MPVFCQYATNNIFFENAYANSAWTLPSHASIFTGLYESHHNISTPYESKLAENIPLLSDVLHTNGYETVFFFPPNEPALPIDDVYKRGMTRLVSDGYGEDNYIDRALQILQQNTMAGKKTFLNFHSYTCHEPYFFRGAPLKFTKNIFPFIPTRTPDVFYPFTEGFYQYMLTRIPEALKDNEYGNLTDTLHRLYNKLKPSHGLEADKRVYNDTLSGENLDPVVLWGFYDEYFYKDKIDIHNAAQMEYVRSLYDQKLYDVDDTVIRKIRDAMTKTSLKNNTIVIITSEHGEEFGEHGVFGHTTLYDLNLKVPFMMSIPHMDPFSISNNVQLVDIMPTILSVLGIKNHFTFDGTSLVPLLSGQQIPDRLLIAEGGYWQDTLPQKAIRDGNWKVLIALKGTEIIPYELYNIKVDPQEKNNVILSNYATAKRIIEKYKRALN